MLPGLPNVQTPQLPWEVIGPTMALAVLATAFAASRPASAVTRLSTVAALSGRPAKLDGLGSLRSVPTASLLLILVGMPLAGAVAGWLLAGREPPTISRQPLG